MGAASAVTERIRAELIRELPLPEGYWARCELSLLAWALVGSWPRDLDRRVALYDAPGKQEDLSRDGLTHVTRRSGPKTVGEYWVIIRSDGRARHYAEYPAAEDLAGFDRYEVVIDQDSRIASDRYRSILAGLAEQLPAAGLDIMRNPLVVAERADQGVRCQVLQDAARMLQERYLEPIGREGKAAVQRLDSAGGELERSMRLHRDRLAVDANEASVLLMAGGLAWAVSVNAEGWIPFRYGEYLARAADQLSTGRWESMRYAISDAFQAGYHDALGSLADLYYETAKRYRDLALDAPAEPWEFAQRLFRALPYAAAAANLSRWAAPLAGGAAGWMSRQSQTEELMVRLADGLAHQWRSWAIGDQGDIPRERRLVEEAQLRGDDAEVRRLLLSGEYALLRPRSYRPFLLGERPLSDLDWRGFFQPEPRPAAETNSGTEET
ncbi:MAG TPA: hypothetical protein VGI00_06950 [Streptosporangiaceae bacterium]|jgi:hypothetical protein